MEDETSTENMSEEELAERLSQLVGSSPTPEEKQNIHTFLTKVIQEEDTTKLGYLKDDEIGMPTHPLRTYKDLELFCKSVANMDYYGEYLGAKANILTGTSLSRDGKLINLSVIQKKELTAKDLSSTKENKGWFKPKKEVNKYPT